MLRGLTFAVAPFAYAGSGGALVRRFKLDGEFAAGAWLCRAMARHLAPRLLGPWRNAVLVPVPLHARRRRERGFDQALHLAHALARRFGLAVAGRGLVRKLATLPQGDPRVLSRDGNVAGAFAVPRPSVVAARRIVLVDDVLTSGATARTCAAALLRAGASAVGLVTACRS